MLYIKLSTLKFSHPIIKGLVAQTILCYDKKIGVKRIARTPPKRQVEGSNPSEPALFLIRIH
jgi:hypothetical protein